jgi:hypothetical protein
MFDPTPFDLDEINAALAAIGLDDGKRPDTVPEKIVELVDAVRATHGTRQLRRLIARAVALWWQLAERMPPRSTSAHKTQAGMVLLLAVAANIADVDEVDDTIAVVLDAIGWMSGDGTPLTPMAAARAAWDTRALLQRLGAFADHDLFGRRGAPTDEGVTFARAALQTW